MRREVVLGLDLAQRQDWSALVAVAATRPDHRAERRYDVVSISRWRDESYVAVPGRVRALEAALRAAEPHRVHAETGRSTGFEGDELDIRLIADQTGIGLPVIDHLRSAGLDPVGVTITGGDQVVKAGWNEFRVPKRDLVGAVAILLQTRRLRFAEGLPGLETLLAELRGFKATITLGGHDRYEAGAGDWRERPTDDVVLALALACWYAESAPKGGVAWDVFDALAPYFGRGA